MLLGEDGDLVLGRRHLESDLNPTGREELVAGVVDQHRSYEGVGTQQALDALAGALRIGIGVGVGFGEAHDASVLLARKGLDRLDLL